MAKQYRMTEVTLRFPEIDGDAFEEIEPPAGHDWSLNSWQLSPEPASSAGRKAVVLWERDI